jgi:hypothetical protein
MNRVTCEPGYVLTRYRASPEGVTSFPEPGYVLPPTILTKYGPSTAPKSGADAELLCPPSPQAARGAPAQHHPLAPRAGAVPRTFLQGRFKTYTHSLLQTGGN